MNMDDYFKMLQESVARNANQKPKAASDDDSPADDENQEVSDPVSSSRPEV